MAAAYTALAELLRSVGTDQFTARRQALTGALNTAYDELLRARSTATGLNWLDRWVDLAQVAPPALFRRNAEASAEVSPAAGQKADPMVTPMRLILVFLSIVVILAVIELLFRNTIHERLD